MLGGYFLGRSIRQNAIAVLKVEDPTHPATRMLGGSWPVVDEFYHFGTAPWDASRPKDNIDVLFGNRIPMGFTRDRVHVLLSLDTDEDRTSPTFPTSCAGGDYPQAWWRDFGNGRIVLHRRSATATTSGATTRCSAPTSSAASAGRSGSRTERDAPRRRPRLPAGCSALTLVGLDRGARNQSRSAAPLPRRGFITCTSTR